jgi:phage terminase large subunit-like protein
MIEFPQTQNRLTEASQNLYELIKWRRLKVYRDADLTEHIKNAVAKETARGFRIVKEKASHKIDLAIALAMASLMAHKSPVKRAGTWGSEYLLRDEGRPPLAKRERTRRRKPLDSFTDAVLSGRARIIERD